MFEAWNHLYIYLSLTFIKLPPALPYGYKLFKNGNYLIHFCLFKNYPSACHTVGTERL